MPRLKILALILAGGAGSRLDVLTAERAKPAMPFAGTYRLIDFALSNCMHSGISDVWVVEQYELHSLNEHLSNGRPWDLDRTYGGLLVLPPYEADSKKSSEGGATEGGFAEGNADAIYRHRRLIQEFAPDLLIVLSADHVYKLDFNDVIEKHLTTSAAVTVVTTEVPLAEAARFGNVKVDADGLITDFKYKPDPPVSPIVTSEVFVYTTSLLFEYLDRLSGDNPDSETSNHADAKDDSPGTNLRDFGHELLPSLVKDKKAYAHELSGYWRDVGTLESYWQGHMDLLDEKPGLNFDDPSWSLHTTGAQRVPARIHESARIIKSMISPGCTIRGTVRNSVLAPGVVVEESAIVENSVVLHDCRIEHGAHVSHSIIDVESHVKANARIGSAPSGDTISDEDLTIVGTGAQIEAETIVTAGSRIKPHAIC